MLKVVNKADRTEILVYDPIGSDYWDGVSAKEFRSAVKAAKGPIDLRVNSPGGSVFEADAMFQALIEHRHEVVAHVDGLAASAASYLIMAGKEILVGEQSFIMVHNPYTIAMGDSNDMRKTADLLDSLRGSMVKMYKRHTKASDEQIHAWLDEETWFNADDAVANGFATRKVETVSAIAACDPGKFKFKNTPAAVKAATEQAQQAAAAARNRIAEIRKKISAP